MNRWNTPSTAAVWRLILVRMRSAKTVVVTCAMVCATAMAFRAPRETSLDELKLLRTLDLEGATNHVQGVDTDGTMAWITSVDTPNRKGNLHEYSVSTGVRRRVLEIQDGARFHPGGLSSDAAALWLPVAEYRANSTSVIQRRNKKNLELDFQFAVADHIGCIAVTPTLLIGGNWDSRDFYVWDHQGKLIRKIISSTKNAYQDMKFDGEYVVASGLLQDKSGAIDWLDLQSLKLVHRMKAGKTDRGASFTREGMGIHADQLWLLPEDQPSRLFVFGLGR